MDESMSPLAQPATRQRLSAQRTGVLCSIFFGASVTEAVSVYLLPLTLALFTRDPNVIFWVLAINPAFGFIAQPLVGLLSDKVWTRLGRRAVFLVTAGPIVAATLICVPHIGPLWLLVLTVVVWQFFHDVINGCDLPLIADLVPPEQRTLALGFVKAAENVGFLLVLTVGMPLVDEFRQLHGQAGYGLPLYLAAAACQILFVGLAALFLDEQPIERQARPRLTPRRYVADFLRQPMLPRIACAYFLRAFARSAVVGSVALYGHYTLQLGEKAYGASWGLMPFIALAAGVPLGMFAERLPKQRVLQLGFAMLIAGSATAYFFGRTQGLMVSALVFGLGDTLLEVTHKAFMADYYPADLVGQLSGAVNCFYAAGRTTALLLVGASVRLANPNVDWNSIPSDGYIDYSIIWCISAAAAILGIAVLATTRDFRHELRTRLRPDGIVASCSPNVDIVAARSTEAST